MTFGYGRVEIVAALINYTTLFVIGLSVAMNVWQTRRTFIIRQEHAGGPHRGSLPRQEDHRIGVAGERTFIGLTDPLARVDPRRVAQGAIEAHSASRAEPWRSEPIATDASPSSARRGARGEKAPYDLEGGGD